MLLKKPEQEQRVCCFGSSLFGLHIGMEDVAQTPFIRELASSGMLLEFIHLSNVSSKEGDFNCIFDMKIIVFK